MIGYSIENIVHKDKPTIDHWIRYVVKGVLKYEKKVLPNYICLKTDKLLVKSYNFYQYKNGGFYIVQMKETGKFLLLMKI